MKMSKCKYDYPWFNALDKLPTSGEEVIVIVNKNGFVYTEITYIDGNQWVFCVTHDEKCVPVGSESDSVVAWMKVPDYPGWVYKDSILIDKCAKWILENDPEFFYVWVLDGIKPNDLTYRRRKAQLEMEFNIKIADESEDVFGNISMKDILDRMDVIEAIKLGYRA